MQNDSVIVNEADPIPKAFDELSKQIKQLSDVILRNIGRGFEKPSGDPGVFSFDQHKLVSKSWFLRVSYSNKKRFVMNLIDDVQSAWTLSLLLKSTWNCHPKDSVPSPYEAWSSYDQIPMDHNRSALPMKILSEVMETERKWFGTLDMYQQAEFLIELLKCAGGPIVWAVYNKARAIFDTYQEELLQNIEECNVVVDIEVKDKKSNVDDKSKKDSHRKTSATGVKHVIMPDSAEAQREVHIAQWNSMINSMKDSYKLEEVELTFVDGTKKRMWKVKGPKLEITETVDLLQLLPLSVAKRILSFVPRQQLSDCARVNKYWSFIVDELKAEVAARDKIDLQIQKMKDLMLLHDTDHGSTSMFPIATTARTSYSIHIPSLYQQPTATHPRVFDQKSAMTSTVKQARRKVNAGKRAKKCPIRNLSELSEKLNRRGAADDNLWVWCKRVLELHKIPDIMKDAAASTSDNRLPSEGVIAFGNMHFPCPLMTEGLELPLKQVITKDFTVDSSLKKKRDVHL